MASGYFRVCVHNSGRLLDLFVAVDIYVSTCLYVDGGSGCFGGKKKSSAGKESSKSRSRFVTH